MGNIKFLLSVILFLIISSSFTSFNSREIYYRFNLTDLELDPETADWLSRVDSAGGTVSDSLIEAVDDYIKEVKGLKYQSVSIRNLL
ncbi:MAG: hypothetical protein ABI528_09670, partial [bacterium]